MARQCAAEVGVVSSAKKMVPEPAATVEMVLAAEDCTVTAPVDWLMML